MITLYKTDKAGRLRFFIVHDLQRSLLDGYALTVAEAVGEKAGKDLMRLFENEADGFFWLKRVLSRKRRSGYRELYSYGVGAAALGVTSGTAGRRAG